MNILFMSLLDFQTFHERNIYADLLRRLMHEGHTVYCVSPTERRQKQKTHVIRENGGFILKQRIGNIQKVNLIEKGISTLLVEPQFIHGIKKHFGQVKFDLVLYATPPITFARVIRYVKKRDGARTYLMLKDIFPQNSVDLGMLPKRGLKGLIYRYFRRKEQRLYALSDTVGCMSPANRDYVLAHNPEIPAQKVEVFPNCIQPVDLRLSREEKQALRIRYDLPQDKKIFVYGGNLGRPQDVPFVVQCLKAAAGLENAYFLIAGSGTDRHFLESYVQQEAPAHVRLLGQLPKEEYDRMIACCDVGLIFLDHRFTIPNFPSRLLAYMQAGLPVLACTDASTDIGSTLTQGCFGWWCESSDTANFLACLKEILAAPTQAYAAAAWEKLCSDYNVETRCAALLNGCTADAV